MLSIIDDVTEVVTIVTIFSLSVVLRYPLSHITVGQKHVAAG
jgi:hypothetical protein